MQEELARARAPELVGRIGVNLVGPTVLAHGTSGQKARWLPLILPAEQLFCQLFSEPDAGSDLAAVSTRAVRVDGGWELHGQKVWTSYAQFADRQAALALFAGWTGLDLAPFDPQTPLARAVAQLTGDGAIEGNRSALQSFLELDPDRNWTVGEVAAHMCLGARGPVVIGSGPTVAEELERL